MSSVTPHCASVILPSGDDGKSCDSDGGNDFGDYRKVAISGTSYEDTDGDGTQDGGEPGNDGRTVKLEAERIGGQWVTSLEAFDRFRARLNQSAPNVQDRTPAELERANKRALAQIAAIDKRTRAHS